MCPFRAIPFYLTAAGPQENLSPDKLVFSIPPAGTVDLWSFPHFDLGPNGLSWRLDIGAARLRVDFSTSVCPRTELHERYVNDNHQNFILGVSSSETE